jgi:light-regulated signal transduction histidine kinase (bacteriophytochrome)
LERRALQLEATNKELEAFSYSVSHDLRAPLRALDGLSQILVEDYAAVLPEEANHFLRRVRLSAQKMDQLISDLLLFSQMGRHPLKKVRTSIDEIISQALEEFQGDLEDRSVEIIHSELIDCWADPALLKQVYINLLANAIKFTRNREHTKIELGCLKSNGAKNETVYFVKDNGVGFDMQEAEKLFGVFQRLHRDEDFEGTGVGLATVQRIIHRHGGRTWAEAEVDRGATFYFTLPNGEEFETGRKTEGIAIEFPG